MQLSVKPWLPRLAAISTPGFLLAALVVASAPTVVTAATPQGSATHPAGVAEQDAAFAAVLAAQSDAQQRARARAFLRAYGNDAPVSRLATTHALLGAALWRASCPRALDGLCVDVAPVELADDACVPSLRDRLVPRARSPKLAEAALAHLEQASWLADVPPPADPDEARAFREAIAEALVRLADHDLEALLGLEPPPGPFSMEPEDPTTLVLKDYTTQLMTQGGALIEAYAELKATGSAGWVLVAASRSGLVTETTAEALNAVPLPTGMDDETETAYCEELGGMLDMIHDKAREVYAWCVERAEEHDLTGVAVETCHERLDVLESAS